MGPPFKFYGKRINNHGFYIFLSRSCKKNSFVTVRFFTIINLVLHFRLLVFLKLGGFLLSNSEGFFAKKIVLIEDDTEKCALPNYFIAEGYDLDVYRIALVGVGSVDNIAYLLLIFIEFRIPCYAIFD